MTATGRVRRYSGLGSRHLGLSGAERRLTDTLLPDTKQWANGGKGRGAACCRQHEAGDRPELPFDTLAEIVGNAAVSDPLTLLQRQGQAKKLAKNVSPKPLAFPR